MLKKVLSVVLALVLALGVCAVAASAVTATQLADLLNQLPNEYNAYFYKDATEAKILAAREAAEAALESGAGINEAYAQCQDAFDEAYAYEEVEFDPVWGATVAVFTNRDESKAVADYYYETDAPDYLMPGDRFDVTFSIKTNFPMASFRVGLAYDSTILTLDEPEDGKDSTLTICPTLDPNEYDTTMFTYVKKWGFNPTTGERIPDDYQQRFPLTWDQAMQDQYSIAVKEIATSSKSKQFLNPTEKTEIFTLTFKVKDDAEIGSTADLFCSQDMVADWDTYYLFDGDSFPSIQITRTYGYNKNEAVAGLLGEQVDTLIHKDEGAYCNQTVNFHGNALKTYTIGEEPAAELDYTALEAAVAEIANYDSFDYTDASWADYETAVAAGSDELTAKELKKQDDVDALTKTVTDARDALVPFESDAEIISIKENSTPVVGKLTDLEVLVSKPVQKLQFVDMNGNTFTYAPDYVRTDKIVDNEDGTQTWFVKLVNRDVADKYNVHVKDLNKQWSDKYYRYKATVQEFSGQIISAEVPDSYDGRLIFGRHDLVVTTSLDVVKVQVIYCGTTATFAPSSTNAKVEEVDGKLVWTLNFNFCKAGTNIPYNFASRTAVTSWETSENVALNLDVLH